MTREKETVKQKQHRLSKQCLYTAINAKKRKLTKETDSGRQI